MIDLGSLLGEHLSFGLILEWDGVEILSILAGKSAIKTGFPSCF